MRKHGRTLNEDTERCIDAPGVHNAYDRSKAAGERRVRKVIEEGLDAVIVHPTGVIGPWGTAESLEALRSNPELDHSKARDELGYNPRPTQDSVRDIYRWFSEHGRRPADAMAEDR